jgi:hypothetical protein
MNWDKAKTGEVDEMTYPVANIEIKSSKPNDTLLT